MNAFRAGIVGLTATATLGVFGVAHARVQSVNTPVLVRLDDAAKEDPYTAGKSWTATVKGNTKWVRLKARKGDRVTFRFEGAAAGAIWEVAGELKKGVVTIDTYKRIVDPKGQNALMIKDVSGAAKINADGTLDLTASGRVSGNGVQNQAISVSIAKAKPD